MILVFILCTIIILSIGVIYIGILSTIRISVKNLEISNIEKNKEKIENNYQVIFSLWLFNKIKWFQFKLNNKRARKIYTKMQLEKYDFKKLEQDIKTEDLKQIKKLKPKISLLNLKVKIGTEDAVITSFIVFFISTVISIILPHVIKKDKYKNKYKNKYKSKDKNKYKYEILPVYMGKNIYEIGLNCIIEIKMVHIINIIYVLVKKRRGEKNERTSNRRAYGYSYE